MTYEQELELIAEDQYTDTGSDEDEDEEVVEEYEEDVDFDESRAYKSLEETEFPIEALTNAKGTAELVNLMASDTWDELTQTIGQHLENEPSDNYLLVRSFQSVVSYDVRYFSIGKLLEVSQHQLQFEHQLNRISAILAGKSTGLVSTGILLRPPLVVRVGEGTYLGGGHHRINALVFLLSQSGVSQEQILNQRIECLVASVDLTSDSLPVDPTLSRVTQADRERAGLDLMANLLLADNQSRTVGREESAQVKWTKAGIVPSDSDSVRKGWMNREVTKLTLSQAIAFIGSNMANESGIIKTANSSASNPIQIPNSDVARDGFTLGTWVNVMKSMFAALQKEFVEDYGYAKPRPKWGNDLKSLEAMERIVKFVLLRNSDGESLLQRVGVSLAHDPNVSGNVARNATVWGNKLAYAVNQSLQPKFPQMTKKEGAAPKQETVKGKSKKLTSKAHIR